MDTENRKRGSESLAHCRRPTDQCKNDASRHDVPCSATAAPRKAGLYTASLENCSRLDIHATSRKNESNASTLRLAILVDADNAQTVIIEEILSENKRFGEATSTEHALLHGARIVYFWAWERRRSDATDGQLPKLFFRRMGWNWRARELLLSESRCRWLGMGAHQWRGG